MNRLRRHLLRAGLIGSALSAALAAGLLAPLRALAGAWPSAAFDDTDVDAAMRDAGIVDPAATQDILIKAPEIAENGAQVPIEVQSNVADTRIIYLFVDKNLQPMVGSFELLGGAEPFISTRIKMGETSNLRVVVQAGGKYFMIAREIKVTIGGCGT
jgi:sulfur-oxidizing protein SoxY